MIFSVVSPVYKGKECIEHFCERVTKVIDTLEGIDDYEIILVEDCGRDGSWEIIEDLANKNPHIHGAQLSRNFGQHHAITAGLDICKGTWAVVMDSDLQDCPEDIPVMWGKAQEGYDVVCARRGERKDPIWKKTTSRLFHLFFEWLSGLKYDSRVANFRLISRRVIDAYGSMRESTRGFGAQVHWLGFPTTYIDVQHAPRHEGKSSYTVGKLIGLAVNTIISYSNKPLKLSIGLGATIFLISLTISMYFFFRKFFYDIPVDGWTSLIISIWLLGGLIIANLGVVGLYIGKIFDETKGRPIYAISKRINC